MNVEKTKRNKTLGNRTKQNFDVDINDVISLVKIWGKSFMHLLTKHKEILEQKCLARKSFTYALN